MAAQENIGGIINSYFVVDSIDAGTKTKVFVDISEDISSLQRGDKVLLIQMTGSERQDLGPTIDHPQGNVNNTGQYEFLAVASVDEIAHTVTFTATLKGTYDAGEKFQLVKVYEGEEAVIQSTITPLPWNGSKGGIIAMVVYKKLTFEADIDASASGFRGANPEPYSASCRPDNDTMYFHVNALNRAGRKGEGILTVNDSLLKGGGKAINGGGGGVGLHGGGGGGGNWGIGGNGGGQYLSDCSSLQNAGPGTDIQNNYATQFQLFMGGGGGSSTYLSGFTATKGGNGGGLVIILSDSIDGNNHSIISNGQSVVTSATAGAGGGGAGGTIALEAKYYLSALNIHADGGKGGNTVCNATKGGGAGGGGGGGYIRYSGDGAVPSNFSYSFAGGSRGTSACGKSGSGGNTGAIANGLKVRLNGFVFNTISGPDTICAGTHPDTIWGSTPKAGVSMDKYSFQWLRSTDSINWEAATGANGLTWIKPDTLGETMYFTRVVSIPTESISDTALAVKTYVWPKIRGNNLAIRDTLCERTSPGVLNGGVLSGGNGTFTYKWQSSPDALAWTDRSPSSTLNEAILDATKYYRRIAYSIAVCFDTSNVDTLTVLPDVSNNSFFSADTTICNNLQGGVLRATQPANGDGKFRYQWLQSTNNSTYTLLAGQTGDTLNAGPLTSTRYYKRIVYSGGGNVCRDTTAVARTINVLPTIVVANIRSDSTRYCYGDTPSIVLGGSASGGSGEYAISWYRRALNESWVKIDEANEQTNYLPSSPYYDTAQVQRVIVSGADDACIDSSNILQIDVLPEITNLLVSEDETICELGVPTTFIESPASGGAGGFSYLWISQIGTFNWQLASTDNGPNNNTSYTSSTLDESTRFARIATSQICADTSNSISITVYPKIENNYVIGGATQYTCYNTSKPLIGQVPTGGDPISGFDFQWQQSLDQLAWTNLEGSLNALQTPVLTDIAYYRRLLSSGETSQCKDTSDAVLLNINPLPIGDIISSTDTICDDVNLLVAYNVSGNGPWTFELGNSLKNYGTFDVSATTGSIAVPMTRSDSLRVINIIDDSTCYADLSGISGRVIATVFAVPQAFAGDTDSVCGLKYVLNPEGEAEAGLWTSTGAEFNDPTLFGAEATAAAYGTTTMKWKIWNWQCFDSSTIDITFFEQPLDVDAGADQYLNNEFQTVLAANENPFTSTWRVLERTVDFVDPSLYNTTVYFDSVGIYNLVWTIQNGVCEAISDTVEIEVGDILVYDGFSPNGDGVNDHYTLKLSGRPATFTVISQFGTVVYEEDATERIEWDGKNSKGQDLPTGIYFFVIKEEGRPKDITGYFELRR